MCTTIADELSIIIKYSIYFEFHIYAESLSMRLAAIAAVYHLIRSAYEIKTKENRIIDLVTWYHIELQKRRY